MPPTLAALAKHEFLARAEVQSQVLSREQLRGLGVRRVHITRRVDGQVWQEVGDHVVVLHPGPLSRQQQFWAAVLHAGPNACLAGLSALEAAGLTGFSDPEVVAVAPHGRGRRRVDGAAVTIRVTEARGLPPSEVRDLARPPRVIAERAAVQAASTAKSDRACRTILAMSVQQRLISPFRVRTMVLASPTLPRRALILETLDDVEGGSESLPELDFLAGVRRFGLPEPTRQQRVHAGGGRYVLDADFDPWQVTAEINGAHHLTPEQKETDDIRRTRLAIGGRLVVDIGSHTVRHDIELAALLTADALLSRGWVPPPDVRRRLEATATRHPTFTWTSTGGAVAR